MIFKIIFFLIIILSSSSVISNDIYKNPIPEEKYVEIEFTNNSFYKGLINGICMDGFGSMFYSDGSIYKGFWSTGKRNESGTMYYKDGSNYNGIWKQGRPIGNGTLILSNLQKIKARFDNGIFGWGIYKVSKITQIYDFLFFWYYKFMNYEDLNFEQFGSYELKLFCNVSLYKD
tara:strand:+ start:364 stop:885 length:522 start_codon:yes stop_codon:yes gene_type:complete